MRDLGKWPRLTVKGERISDNQAEEIIIRTTDWYDFMINNKPWKAEAERIATSFGWPAPPKVSHAEWGTDKAVARHAKRAEVLREWCERWQVLDLNYLRNHRIASSWIGGAHGWCAWDGRIGATSYNLGKWPTHDEILREWALIAEAFPWLTLRAQLWPNEGDEPPAVEYIVRGGTVGYVVEPATRIAPTDVFDTEWWAEHGHARGPQGERLVEQGCTGYQLARAMEGVLRRRVNGEVPA